jgi:2-polyprenyl-6-methoxyphenol hydroxylase-like FAD-dependent oxidoreductase
MNMRYASTTIKSQTPAVSSPPSLRVIIVGAGIGGLSAAIALRRAGHEAVVLERSTQLEATGAGITLFGNAMDALNRLGVADAITTAGAVAASSAILTSNGDELTTLAADLLEGMVAVHRGDVQAALLDAVGDARLGVDVTSVEQTPDGVIVNAADGTTERGDLLVGADGLRSMVRAYVAPSAPRYSGYTAWRGVSPIRIEPGRISESWGTGERFGLVDIGSRTYWFATANTPEGESGHPATRKAELLRRFSDWHAPIATVLDATPDSAILRNDVYHLEALTRWSEGRIVLLGDAAHATTPGIGQGAAQAIEDAVVLADQLAIHNTIDDALARYESIRRPRAELVLKLSRRTDRAAQLASPIGGRLRNLIVRRIPPRAQAKQLAPIVHHRPS